MNNRIVMVLGAASVAVLTACGGSEPALGTRTAEVTVNGERAAKIPVECSQAGWTWLISDFGEKTPGFTAAVTTGEKVTAHSVEIRDIEGFTGAFWEGTVGNGKATVNGQTITISGTAKGEFADNPATAAEATYEITTKC
ncbi:lipoprotein LpqH [Mycolicibacterium litorale]|uniref:lipoprotein LpqH n=1 Tax=Mycolicibacterium litorale TaxID=758802 RepID=UPI0010668047|nr:lipoprotein LpqH [Mycolicibacterium litorale]MCV7414844.1 lipoprotein LpqH [Mycolicibacterium litorale]TDY08091.1 lipoprotein antigen [Mycolicibacterium litorale]